MSIYNCNLFKKEYSNDALPACGPALVFMMTVAIDVPKDGSDEHDRVNEKVDPAGNEFGGKTNEKE